MMRTSRTFLLTLVLAVSTSASAQRIDPPSVDVEVGTTLSTPPLVAGAIVIPEGALWWCSSVNVSETSRLISIRLFDAFGNQLNEPASCGSIPPGRMCIRGGIPTAAFLGVEVAAYCRITVQGSKEGVRGALQLMLGSGQTVASVDAR